LIHEGENREIKKGRFQDPLEFNKSDIIKSGNEDLLKGRGSGEKKGIDGIQEEFQIESEENLWIL
jgi:hypothetical protein